MKKINAKRPEYDGNTSLLYDFMVAQGLKEEDVVEKMGMRDLEDEFYQRAPWKPVSIWLKCPVSVPAKYILPFAKILNAPIEAIYMRSKILNGLPFDIEEYRYSGVIKRFSDDALIRELQRRGYMIGKPI